MNDRDSASLFRGVVYQRRDKRTKKVLLFPIDLLKRIYPDSKGVRRIEEASRQGEEFVVIGDVETLTLDVMPRRSFDFLYEKATFFDVIPLMALMDTTC